jgi:hypothetical protein
MRKLFNNKIPFLFFFTFLFIFSVCPTSFADNTEIYSFAFDWYGVRLIFVVLGILLGGLIIKPIRGFFGALGGGLAGLLAVAWFGSSTHEEFWRLIIIGSVPTAIFGGIVGILAHIHKSTREE